MSRQTKSETHAGRAEIEVKQCVTVKEFDACVSLQREVFGWPDLEITPRRHFIASRRAGGWTLGAFVMGEMVGFAHLMVAVLGERELIGYSHMMAVTAAYQNRGVGARLKWAQRERALSEGRSHITWTWDPMQARNAYFNLNRLGVTVRSYGINFYGTDDGTSQTDAARSQGIDSDRLFAEWDLNSARVAALSKGAAPEQGPTVAPVRTIAIPPDWSALLKSDTRQARREQRRVRDEFTSAFASGLVCVGFERDALRPRYLLYESIRDISSSIDVNLPTVNDPVRP